MPKLTTVALLIAVPWVLVGQTKAPTAKADGESLQGAYSATNPDIVVYRGVPYAMPPLGDLRWRPPVPRSKGSGPRQATEFSASCAQTNRLQIWTKSIAKVFGTEAKVPDTPLVTSEDCLYLNVWTPRQAKNVPVMVWIHGGSNLNGEGHSDWYEGTNLAAKGVVVVTINYRLGVFGFMAHPALTAESPNKASGNYGLMDQLEALRWVQRNIAAFGGDPARVTVFGESAGSIDILHLLAAPQSAGLIHRAIAQSGAPMAAMLPLKAGELQGLAVGKALGVDSAPSLARLRAASTAEVLAAGTKVMGAGQLIGPLVDGWFLPDMTVRIFEAGKQLNAPLLIGTNALEMTTLRTYMPRVEPTATGFQRWVGALFGAAAPNVLTQFPVADSAQAERVLYQAVTDVMFTCPTRVAATTMTRRGAPTFLYHFTRVLPGGESLGAYHAAEIGYVFGNRLPWLPREPVDDQLSAAMMGYWTRFAASGDPNGADAPGWSKYTPEAAGALELGREIRAVSRVRGGACDAMEPAMRALWSKAN